MKIKSGQEHCGIFCNSSLGPAFGGGHDFVVSNSHSYSNLGYSYRAPPSSADAVSLLAGDNTFSASELEVFCYMK